MENENANRQLTFIDEYDFDDSVQRDVDLVRAFAVSTAVGRLVVTVAELFWRDILKLRDWRGRREDEGNFID